jgi:hypothetical protein
VLLAVNSQALTTLATFPAATEGVSKCSNHLLSASEGKENKETLQSVEGNECVPEPLDIEITSNEAHGPSEPHDKCQSDVQAEVPLCPTAGGEASCGCGREDHVCTG